MSLAVASGGKLTKVCGVEPPAKFSPSPLAFYIFSPSGSMKLPGPGFWPQV